MITADMVRRKVIFDCMADPQKAFVLTGMVGVSEEGAEKEEEDSLNRLAAVAPLVPILDTMADWLAETSVELQLAAVDPNDIPPAFREHMLAMFYTVIKGSLAASFSVLNDLGMIEIGGPDGCR